MEQHQQMMHQQQQQQHPDSSQNPESSAVLHLAHAAATAGLLLQLWAYCVIDKADSHQQPTKLTVAVSSLAFLADVAAGVAAVWRSQGAVQQWRATHGDATAVAVAPSTQGVMGAAALHSSALMKTTAAGRAQHSTRQRADLVVGQQAARWMAKAVTASLRAANKLTLRLFQTIRRSGDSPHGAGAAYDLQWVMVVYAAVLTGQLHKQQHGMTAVQLHTTEPATTDHNSQQDTRNNDKAGSNKKSTSSKTSSSTAGAQQASSSSAAASSRARRKHGSVVPPYHLQVLQAAGVPSLRLTDLDELFGIVDGNARSMDSGVMPTCGLRPNRLCP
jgi:hypothetical protein